MSKNKKIESYSLVSGWEEEFNTIARRLIKNGYEPFGSVSNTQYGRGTKIAQSFVKYAEEGDDHATVDQPQPVGTGREIAPLVIEDINARIKKGVETYGEPLKSNNGRKPLTDAYQEAIDLVIYLRQELEEKQLSFDDAIQIDKYPSAILREEWRMQFGYNVFKPKDPFSFKTEYVEKLEKEVIELRTKIRGNS